MDDNSRQVAQKIINGFLWILSVVLAGIAPSPLN